MQKVKFDVEIFYDDLSRVTLCHSNSFARVFKLFDSS